MAEQPPVRVLILGASYGSLLATKLLMAGHSVTLVCTPSTAELINREGTVVRFPIRGREGLVEIRSGGLPGALRAVAPGDADPTAFDLVVLGMQEPQYGADGVRQLMARVAAARVPCLAIMNMPPLAYLRRIAALDAPALAGCYADATVWDAFDPAAVTLASPDPQAFRPPDEGKNVLQVGLPTNFKAARFTADAPTALLRRLEAGVDAARFAPPGGPPLEIPTKLRVSDSLFVPLAKWPMLLTGNYRCATAGGMVSIRDAVHGDADLSRAVYEWVVSVCVKLGAAREDLVPFEKYAAAAEGLLKPSSAARALFGGATAIERVDKLVAAAAAQLGERNAVVDGVVALVDAQLAANRAAAGGGGGGGEA
ncbi:MAG: hypothetical protein J3K34DRAFT_406442 [Monoraphidium minutum]|nr:MAG: hypothetical protein J3K34DRAFT_406442 [Monoraphidium minutum]